MEPWESERSRKVCTIFQLGSMLGIQSSGLNLCHLFRPLFQPCSKQEFTNAMCSKKLATTALLSKKACSILDPLFCRNTIACESKSLGTATTAFQACPFLMQNMPITRWKWAWRWLSLSRESGEAKSSQTFAASRSQILILVRFHEFLSSHKNSH